MPRNRTPKAAAAAARMDRRPILALTAISILASLVLALGFLR